MWDRITKVRFSKSGFADILFDNANVIPKITFIKSEHTNQYEERLKKTHGCLINFDIRLRDIFETDFLVKIQSLSAMINDLMYKTSEPIRFYPDIVNDNFTYFDCMMNSAIEPIGDTKTNEGNGVSFSLLTIDKILLSQLFTTFNNVIRGLTVDIVRFTIEPSEQEL